MSHPKRSVPKTTALNISLPEMLKAYVEARVRQGGYASSSEFVRELIRDAMHREAERERIDGLLLEGLDSGPGTETTPVYWQRRHDALAAAPHVAEGE